MFLKTGIKRLFSYNLRGKIWDIYQRIAKYNLGRKIKSTGYIYLPRSKYHEYEGHLKLISCLKYSVVNSAPRIGKYINKIRFYNQCPTIRVDDTNMSEIEKTLYVQSVINVTPIFQIEIETWGADIIPRTVNDGFYICSFSVRSEEYMCNTKYEFVYDSHFKPLYQ